MKLTTLLAIATGYYFGSKAGEQRYKQILWLSRTIANSQAFHNLLQRLRETVGSALEAITGQRPAFLSTSSGSQQS